MPKPNKKDLCIVYYEIEGEFSVLWKANPNEKNNNVSVFKQKLLLVDGQERIENA